MPHVATTGTFSWRRFLVTFAISMTVLAIMLFVMASQGIALAAPLAGIGGVVLEFDRLEGQGFQLLPVTNDTDRAAGVPMARAKIDRLVITDLHMYKDLKVGGKTVRVSITASPVEISGLVQDMTYQQAGSIAFTQQTVDEQRGANPLSMTAPGVVIEDARIIAHYLFQNKAKLPGMKLEVKVID
ncbi:MAG: hypothetical protein DIU76_08260 [Bacillota bacterium]|nr:MAG: hypothetical protein DIU76_08260 [Bacillota bacterium]